MCCCHQILNTNKGVADTEVEKTSGNQKPLTCSLPFLFSACSSAADALYNTVWTLGCRSYMNSQRAACVCSEEERDELWNYGVQRQLGTSWVFLQMFAAISAQIWDLKTKGKTHLGMQICSLYLQTQLYHLPEHPLLMHSISVSFKLHDSVIINDFDDSKQTV